MPLQLKGKSGSLLKVQILRSHYNNNADLRVRMGLVSWLSHSLTTLAKAGDLTCEMGTTATTPSFYNDDMRMQVCMQSSLLSCKEKLRNIIICCQSPVAFWINRALRHWLKGLGLHTVSALLVCLRARGLGLWP